MHLVLAAQQALKAVYGPEYPQIAEALQAALAARESVGITNLVYDPADGVASLAVGPAALEPQALAEQLRNLQAALERQGAIIESLWIIGGPRVIPFGRLPNPMRDRDGPLLSDCVYGLAHADSPLVLWPVGRTPDAEPPEPGLLAALLRRVALAHSQGLGSAQSLLSLSTARWAIVSEQVAQFAGLANTRLQLAPPFQSGQASMAILQTARLIYCNLHGVRGKAAWYGQAPADTELIPALHPNDVVGLDLAGAIVVSQACFALRLEGLDAPRSLALAFLGAGAAGFIGGHGLTYGAPDPPPSESDLLAQYLLLAFGQANLRLGEALRQAMMDMLRNLLLQQGHLDADDTKTLLGFMLYGDPALAWRTRE